MRCNLARWDRMIRYIVGFLLTFYAFLGGPFWTYIGIYLLATAAWGFSPLYAFLNWRTLKFKRNS